MKKGEAYLTVYLALCLTLILSLYLVLIDGARRSGAGLEAVCVTEAGLQSIMGEYHRELLEQYNLFAIDSSYGTSVCGRKNTEAHLMQYLERNLSFDNVLLSDYLYRDFFGLYAEDAELTHVSILTDGNGAVFRQRAVEAIKDDTGIHMLEKLQEWMQVIEVNGLDRADMDAQKKKVDESLEEYNGKEIQLSDEESVYVEVENPTAQLEEKRRLGILRLVVEEGDKLSERVIDSTSLVENRMKQGIINSGNMDVEDSDNLINRFLFQEYLLRYMGHYGREDDSDALQYQIEYLIAGADSDTDNLRSVANRICAIREAANGIYLLSDKEKRLEMEAAAALVCGLFALPELIPLAEAAILLGWAYAESVYDVKSLLSGGSIPLIKDKDSWHYGLQAALKGALEDETEEGEGLTYEDYLRIFMMLTDLDTLTWRAMNMVEADIRVTPGNADFRLDACYDKLEAVVRIDSFFGYEFEIQRKRTY